jgi:hypothetical protein
VNYEPTGYQRPAVGRRADERPAGSELPSEPSLTAHFMSFDGALVERGFWLYVWRIVAGSQTVLYVGRTGDSSSPHASSPFKRVGQHLEVGPIAKGNSMSKQLRANGITQRLAPFGWWRSGQSSRSSLI